MSPKARSTSAGAALHPRHRRGRIRRVFGFTAVTTASRAAICISRNAGTRAFAEAMERDASPLHERVVKRVLGGTGPAARRRSQRTSLDALRELLRGAEGERYGDAVSCSGHGAVARAELIAPCSPCGRSVVAIRGPPPSCGCGTPSGGARRARRGQRILVVYLPFGQRLQRTASLASSSRATLWSDRAGISLRAQQKSLAAGMAVHRIVGLERAPSAGARTAPGQACSRTLCDSRARVKDCWRAHHQQEPEYFRARERGERVGLRRALAQAMARTPDIGAQNARIASPRRGTFLDGGGVLAAGAR